MVTNLHHRGIREAIFQRWQAIQEVSRWRLGASPIYHSFCPGNVALNGKFSTFPITLAIYYLPCWKAIRLSMNSIWKANRARERIVWKSQNLHYQDLRATS